MPSKQRKQNPTRRDVLRWMTAGAVTAVLPMSAASYCTGLLSLEKHELRLPNWDADGFRVAVLSDLHTDSVQEQAHAKAAIRMAMAEKPDLIALPGDFVNKDREHNIDLAMQALEDLRDANCPVVATLGNHDYDHRGHSRVAIELANSPAKLLRNQTVDIRGVTVAGIDDGLARKARPSFLLEGSYSKSLLALFHEPDYVDIVPRTISLQISGHSHGGQVCLPGGIPIHTSEASKNYWAGYYPNARVPLYVTRGIGTVGPRWRLFCLPEVTILTLRSA